MTTSFVILLVEDNPAEIRLTREALSGGRLLHNLQVVTDARQAFAYLRREPPFETAPAPDLILLDLNLPGIHGLEALAAIKADPALTRIPVVVLTSSDAPQDVHNAYDSFANGYIVKPLDLDQFISTLKSVEEFWFSVVKLPPTPE